MSLTIDILTPERVVMQTQADSLVVPAVDGELGIMQNHAPLIAQLQPGQIRLRHGEKMELFAVSGGFIEVRNKHVAVFAETAEMAREIDIERARQAAEQAKAIMRAPQNTSDLAVAEASLRRALARLRAVEGLHRQHGSRS